MNITNDLVADLIFACSQLRYFEQQFQIEPDIEVNDIVVRYQCRVDDVLCKMGLELHASRQQLKEILNKNTTVY